MTARRRPAVAVAAVVVVALMTSCTRAGAGEEERHSSLDLYLAGTDLTMNATLPPEPGQQNLLGGDIYTLGGTEQAPERAGQPIGRFVGVCTVVTRQERACTGFILLDGRGTLAVQVGVVRGINQGIAITGGTGEFGGIRGSGVEPAVPGHPEDRLLLLEYSLANEPSD